LVEEKKFDYLVPGCTDRSYISCTAINGGRFPGLDRVDACETIFNKGKFRLLADRLGLPIPKRFSLDQNPSCWPIIVKPVDAFSGKGITVLQEGDKPTLEHALKRAREASPTGECLIEQFVDGQLYSHTTFLKDGKVVQDFIVKEDSTVNPFVVDTSRVLQGTPSNLLLRLRDCVENIAKELMLADGLLHTQFVSDGDDFWLIETTRRCPGDLYSQLIELTTGYPYARSYALPFLGESISDFVGDLRIDPIMRHTVTLNSSQSFAYLRFKSALQIERWTPLSIVGDRLKPSPQSRVGILFCRAANQQDLDQIYQRTLQRNLYEIHA
jgi:ATP-grasp domain